MDQSTEEISMVPTKSNDKIMMERSKEIVTTKNSYQLLFEGKVEVCAKGETDEDVLNLCEILRDLYAKVYKLQSQLSNISPNKE